MQLNRVQIEHYKKYYLTCSKWWYLISLVLLGEPIERKRKINENSCTVVPRPMRAHHCSFKSTCFLFFSFFSYSHSAQCRRKNEQSEKKPLRCIVEVVVQMYLSFLFDRLHRTRCTFLGRMLSSLVARSVFIAVRTYRFYRARNIIIQWLKENHTKLFTC